MFVTGKWGPNHAADPIVTRYYYKTSFLQLRKLFFNIVCVFDWKKVNLVYFFLKMEEI